MTKTAHQRPLRREPPCWRWRSAACGGGSGNSGGCVRRRRQGRGQRGHRQGVQPLHRQGRHAQVRRLRRLGLRRPRRTRTTAYSWNFVRALRAHAGDVQAGARGTRAPSSSPTSPTSLGKSQQRLRRRGRTRCVTGVKFEDGTPITSQGRQVRRRARRWTRRRSPTGRRTSTTTSTCKGYTSALQGPVAGPARPEGDRDAGRQDHRLPAGQAVRRLRLLRPAARRPPRCRRRKDTGTKYKEHVVSTGPYKFEYATSWARSCTPGARTRTGTRRPTPNRQAAARQDRRSSST